MNMLSFITLEKNKKKGNKKTTSLSFFSLTLLFPLVKKRFTIIIHIVQVLKIQFNGLPMLRVAVRVTTHQFAQHLKTFQRNWPKGFVQDPLRVFHDPGKDPLAQIAFQVFNMTSRPDAVLLVIVQ